MRGTSGEEQGQISLGDNQGGGWSLTGITLGSGLTQEEL